MAKVQNDFYFRWAQSRIQATYAADQTLDALIEFVGVDTTTVAVEIELPDSTGTDVLNTKEIFIIDQGFAGTNNITVIPNASDGTTIEGEASYVVQSDNAIISFKLIDAIWTKVIDTHPTLNLGSFHMHDNAAVTTISTINTNTDIAGTATASSLNSNFTFGTSPNTLTYTGIKDIIVMLTATASMSKANSSDKIFRILGIKNGSEIEGANIATNILKAMIEVSVSYPVALSTNDVTKLMIRNESDTEDVTGTDLVFTMSEVTR
ncbi:MAG: hypothetical protein V3V81_07350 [Candidatus Bathyarchaeia archaeon]